MVSHGSLRRESACREGLSALVGEELFYTVRARYLTAGVSTCDGHEVDAVAWWGDRVAVTLAQRNGSPLHPPAAGSLRPGYICCSTWLSCACLTTRRSICLRIRTRVTGGGGMAAISAGSLRVVPVVQRSCAEIWSPSR